MKKLLLLLLTAYAAIAFTQSTISGNAFLEGEADHSDIKITFIAKSPTAQSDSVLTDQSGAYAIELANGIYDVTAQKEEYGLISVGEDLLFNMDQLLDEIILSGDLFILEGEVIGRLVKSDYLVKDSMTIPDGKRLIIDAGTRIFFDTDAKLKVLGNLVANGEENDSVVFNSFNPEEMWEGIIFRNGRENVLNYCLIQNASIGVNTLGTTLKIDNSKLNNNQFHIIANSGLLKMNNTELCNGDYGDFENFGQQFGSWISGVMYINECFYHHNEGYLNIGRSFGGGSLTHTRFIDNKMHNPIIRNVGSYAFSANHFYRNTISGEGLSISSSNLTLRHNIFADTANITLNVSNSRVKVNTFYKVDTIKGTIDNTLFSCNILFENKLLDIAFVNESSCSFNMFNETPISENINIDFLGSVVGENINGSPMDTYYNVFDHPEFISEDMTDADFLHLLPGSPAIDAGGDIVNGNDAKTDLGAVPFDDPIFLSNQVDSPSIANIHEIYPNPFSEKLSLQLPKHLRENVSYQILSIQGEVMEEGMLSNNVELDTENWEEGIYFVKIKGQVSRIIKQ